MLRWALLIAATAGVTVALTGVGVPSATLFAALAVGIALAVASLAPRRIPQRAGIAAQGVLGVYIGTMVNRDAVGALGSDWPIVVAIAVATLLLSIGCGVVLAMHRGVTPLTGSLALTAGGAFGLVAIARELGGDDRVVSVVQYLRVALVTASMPAVVALVYHANMTHEATAIATTDATPWYLSIGMLIALVVVGAAIGQLIRLPGAGVLGPLALTVALELSGMSFDLTVPMVLLQISYAVIGWQAGLAFTRESLRVVGRMLPTAIGLIVVLGVATAGLGVVLAHFTGLTPLEGYLATSPGGLYAVLATAVETGSDVTFILAAQVFRILLILFTAPLLARGVVWVSRRLGRQTRATTPASREPISVAD